MNTGDDGEVGELGSESTDLVKGLSGGEPYGTKCKSNTSPSKSSIPVLRPFLPVLGVQPRNLPS